MSNLQESFNEDVCYVKPVLCNDGRIWHQVITSEGYIITTIPNREVAFASARQHGLTPMSMH